VLGIIVFIVFIVVVMAVAMMVLASELLSQGERVLLKRGGALDDAAGACKTARFSQKGRFVYLYIPRELLALNGRFRFRLNGPPLKGTCGDVQLYERLRSAVYQ
jgi:hypothetical protein